MVTQQSERSNAPVDFLNLFCSREGEAWRVHVNAPVLPRYLQRYFDLHGEAYPALLDFDDLDQFMVGRHAAYAKRVARTGSVELTAEGESAIALCEWLSTAFASCVRPQRA
jgi:hypothetical protein